MRRRKMLAAMVMPVLLLAFCRICSADGYIMPEVRVKPPDMPIQRALVKYHDGVETLVIEATFEGEGRNFGWIIPVPSIPQKFERVSPGLLNTLSFQLNYKIEHLEPWEIMPYLFLIMLLALNCFCWILAGWRSGLATLALTVIITLILIPQFAGYRASFTDSPRIKLVGKEAIGNYEIFIIEAKGSSDLNNWLGANGFEKFPEKILPTLNDYIKKKWYFAAAKLTKKNQGLSAPHPIAIQFKSEKPVYPMRLTALSPSDLNLELFIIAGGEAVPINYSLKKIYCDIFDYTEMRSGISPIPEDTLGFVGRGHIYPLRYNQIGHPEAKKLMWPGCVVTRFTGRFSSSEMKEDILFGLRDAEPYRAVVHSRQGALFSALRYPGILFSMGLLTLTIYYGNRLSKASRLSRFKSLARPLLVLSIVCIAVFVSSYLLMGEKKNVQVLGHTSSDWRSAATLLTAVLWDSVQGNLTMSDAELLDSISKEYPNFNPYTREPFIIEDSPGNITVEREEGLITGIIFYWQTGSPYLISL